MRGSLLLSSWVTERYDAGLRAAAPDVPRVVLRDGVLDGDPAGVEVAYFSGDLFPVRVREFVLALRDAPNLRWMHTFRGDKPAMSAPPHPRVHGSATRTHRVPARRRSRRGPRRRPARRGGLDHPGAPPARGAAQGLDLVGVDPGPPAALVVVEVRWRSRRDFGIAEETIDPRKLARLRAGIGRLLDGGALPGGSPIPDLPARLDAVVVEPPRHPGQGPRIRHHRGVG